MPRHVCVLTDRDFEDFRPLKGVADDFAINGVEVSSEGTLTLTRVNVCAVEHGVDVFSGGSATLTDCVLNVGAGHGLDVCGEGSVVVLENRGCGVRARHGAKVVAGCCKTSGNLRKVVGTVS